MKDCKNLSAVCQRLLVSERLSKFLNGLSKIVKVCQRLVNDGKEKIVKVSQRLVKDS